MTYNTPGKIAKVSSRKRSPAPVRAKPYTPALDPGTRPIPGRLRTIAQAVNGSMVQDFADAQRLGEDMQRVQTNDELRKEGLVPDPIQ